MNGLPKQTTGGGNTRKCCKAACSPDHRINLINPHVCNNHGPRGRNTWGGVMKKFYVPAILLSIFTAFALTTTVNAAPNKSIGAVSKVELDAFGTPQNGSRSAKRLTDGVVLNETLETVPSGSLTVDFIDDTNILLGSEAKLTVDDMVFDPNTKKGSAIIKLASGAFFWTSGKMATKDAINIETPVATIGIRGTEFSINIGADGQTNVSVISGLVDFVSKTTGQRLEITPGNNADVSATGQLSALIAGIPNTGDKAVNGQIISAAKKALAAAKKAAKGKGNGELWPEVGDGVKG